MGRRGRRLRQSRARIQPFQGLAPDFAGEPRAANRPGEMCASRNAEAGRRGGGPPAAARDFRARNQPFQGLPPDFPGARRLPKRRTEPLRPHAEERRNASRLEAGGMGRRRRRLRQSRARNSTFSRPCGRFCGRAESGQSPKRDACIPQRRSGRRLGGAPPAAARYFRARIQPFQGVAPDFPGARRLPKRRTEPFRPHAEERRKRRVAKRARAGSGADVCGNPGRGINLFKDFRPIFRALVACRSGGPNLSALMPRSDATRRVPKRAGAGSGADVCGNPGRGINLFKALRPIFRALVACRSGGPNRLRPHAEERRSASRPEAGSIRRRRSNLRKPPSTGSGRGRERTVPARMSRASRRAAPLAEARARAAERLCDRRTRAAFFCCRGRQNKSRTHFLP